jgi:Tfp pilus assembly protein PilV
MKHTKYTLFLLMAGILSGCSVIDNNTRDNTSIQRKAAFALGTSADKIRIENRTADLMKVEFDAIYKGRRFQCYYTGGVLVTSDAICSATDGKRIPSSANCNALLKAAGKC